METKPYGTVLLKAAHILDYLADHPHAKLQEIAKNCQLTSSTALKILDTLLLIQYVEKNSQKEFSIGTKFIRYAHESLAQINLNEIASPFLHELQEKIDETIHLGILENNVIVYIDKLEPKNQNITMSSRIGITRPLYSSAMGKAVLGNFSDQQIQTYLQEVTPLVAYTENTIVNPLQLKKELQTVKLQEVAFDDEEMEKDIFCVGAAILVKGNIKGAFSISIPKYRLTPEKKQHMVAEVLATKEKIQKKLSGQS